jgi:hypothetical protein
MASDPLWQVRRRSKKRGKYVLWKVAYTRARAVDHHTAKRTLGYNDNTEN